MRRPLLNLVAITLALLLQGPALLLQELAWGSMLLRYASRDGITTAITRTFDGKHPCRLCHQVEALQQQQQDEEFPVDPSLKTRLLWAEMQRPATLILRHPAASPLCVPSLCCPLLSPGRGRGGPPTPPPQSPALPG